MNRLAPDGAIPRQLQLPMFKAHEIDAANQRLAQREAEREKNHLRYLKRPKKVPLKHFDDRTLNLWDEPLGQFEDVELSTTTDPYNAKADKEPKCLSESDRLAKQWSDEAIDQLHENMVMYSLRLLNARGNGKEKKAILCWIFDPQPMAYNRSKNADQEPSWLYINASEVPFSFELCCRIAGYDPERIREGLAPILKGLDLDELFKEVEHDINNEQRIRATKVSNTFNIQYSRSAGKGGDSRVETGAPRSTKDRSTLRLRNREAA